MKPEGSRRLNSRRRKRSQTALEKETSRNDSLSSRPAADNVIEESKQRMAPITTENTPLTDPVMIPISKGVTYKAAKFKKKYIKIKTNVKKTTQGL